MLRISRAAAISFAAWLLPAASAAWASEDWLQLKYDSRHSGNAADRELKTPLGLLAAIPLTDAVGTAPVSAGGRIYAVDGAGVAFAIDAHSLDVLWRLPTRGGKRNCNNVSSPAVAGGYLHFGTTAGTYYVVDAASGAPVREIACGEPIFAAPVAANGRVYFVTLGARVYALEPDGTVCWTWDFVKTALGFSGDRWSGAEWARHLKGRVTERDQFLCARDFAVDGKTLVIPAGGTVLWLLDAGTHAAPRALYVHDTPTLGLSVGEDAAVYRQWHRLDNGGQVDVLRVGPALPGQAAPRPAEAETRHLDAFARQLALASRVSAGFVPGTKTNTLTGPPSFCSVSLRGGDVYRCRPEEGFGFCRHGPGGGPQLYAGTYPSIAPPILLRDKAVYGGLDGRLYVVPLAGGGAWSFATGLGKAISAPAAVCDGRVYFGGEDGYLYVLGPGGTAAPPGKDLGLWKVRSPLTGPLAGAAYDHFTSFGNWANTNAGRQQPRPPFALKWVRRYEGTVKHFSSCGGGRMYTHTAEGQVFAVEQETGRLLWRRFFPGVHLSYTAPLYYKERLLVPQAGLRQCRLRCLDAATGALVWEAPFSGTPSWNRQLPPIVYKNLAVYAFSTARFDRPPASTDDGPQAAESTHWLFGHQYVHRFPASTRPLVRAYDLATGKEAWTDDFSALGAGGDDAGMCLMGDTIYYSCFFGNVPRPRGGVPGPEGVTAALDPASGRILWQTTEHCVHAGCTVSAADGRLYLGGYTPPAGSTDKFVWCLDAKDGSLVWQSAPLLDAIHVVTIGPKFLFVQAQYKNGYLLDRETGKILTTLTEGYKCARFTLSGSCLIGPSMDVHDLSDEKRIALLTSGPRFDPSECVGAMVSNGRIFYTGHGAGLQACQVYGPEAAVAAGPWK
ncbi:MAG: PQQ-binding-like beta-propeller repeat protein [Thermoguttaceae bacterium]|jgi:outer membrane protein assembly factor BamB